MFVFLTILIGLVALGTIFEVGCPKGPERLDTTSPFTILYLYPAPGAKIPFACHVFAFLKSPFAPRNIDIREAIYNEDGVQTLWGNGRDREGVIVARISDLGELAHFYPHNFPIPQNSFFKNVSLYVDGKKLQLGYRGYKYVGREFSFTTILNPFLWPGKHVGKIVIELPSGGTAEYEWEFEITWW